MKLGLACLGLAILLLLMAIVALPLFVPAPEAMPVLPAQVAQLDRSIENGHFVFDKYSQVNYQPQVLCPGEKDLRFLQDPHPLYVKEAC